MYLARVENTQNASNYINTWLGYNHTYRINPGEWYDSQNLTNDNYPVMSPRKIRRLIIEETFIQGILLTNDKLVYLSNGILHYGSKHVDLSGFIGTNTDIQQLVRFGAYCLIFPLGIYVNLVDMTEYGMIASTYSAPVGTTITYSICDSEGNALDAEDGEGHSRTVTTDDVAPLNPASGDYWVNTATGAEGLYMWNGTQNTWVPIATTYIKVSIPGATLTDYFEVGDTVKLNSGLSDINEGSTIQYLDDEYMVVIGFIGPVHTETTDQYWTLSVSRELPDLDYVCVDENRVWGCYYGEKNGELINEIYACKLGDFKNWYTYDGIASDSYAVSIGVDGKWTGCISFQGYPTFFKENSIFKVFGTMPSEYQLIESTARGVQNGSYRSLAVVGEYLFYKTASDVVIYDGSWPVTISSPLGPGYWYSAVGGGANNRYYLKMETALGVASFYSYDLEHSTWQKEDPLKVELITSAESGQIYAATKSKIYGIGSNDNSLFLNCLPDETYVKWYAESGDLGMDYPNYKQLVSMTIRAYIPAASEIQVLISTDDGQYEEMDVLRGNGTTESHYISLRSARCDHYRVKLIGHGSVRIYTMATQVKPASEERIYG